MGWSYRNHVASLAGFDYFYSRLRHFLENNTADPKILTTLFFFNQEIFKNAGENEAMLREEREMNILVVNQVAKNFNQATVLDLGYAFEIAMEGRDQIFKHKFCQKVSSRIAQIDVDTYPKQSLRWILNTVFKLGRSGYVGQEWWENIIKLINKHLEEERVLFTFDELQATLSSFFHSDLPIDSLINSLLGDFLQQLDTEDFTYEQFFDFIIIFYGLRINAPELYDEMINAYIEKGYDEDEFSKIGNSKAWKIFKALSELYPNMTSQNCQLFLRFCLKFINENYTDFTTMQTKRAVDFIKAMEIFQEDFQASDREAVHEIIKNVTDFYEKKKLEKHFKSSGINLQMTTGETILKEDELAEDLDEIFDADDSDDEQEAPSKITKADYHRMTSPENTLKHVGLGELYKKDLPNISPPKVELHSDFDDPKLKELTQMIDDNYKKYGNMNKKR